MTDPSPEDAELDLFSFAALQRAPDDVRPSDIPSSRPIAPPLAPTEVNALAPPTETEPAATGTSEQPESDDAGDIMDPDWPRCRKPIGRAKRIYKRVGDVPELTEEQLARSPKLARYRELERNKLNARAHRERERIARERAANLKQKVCRACFRVYLPTERRGASPYCNPRCKTAWLKVRFCFDGEAAWLYRLADARKILSQPSGHAAESLLAAEHVLRYAAPDYSPVEPRKGTLLAALVENLKKLRGKWAPHAAEAVRSGRSDTVLKPDMLAVIGPLLRRDDER